VEGDLIFGRGTKIGALAGEILQRVIGLNGRRVVDIQMKTGSLEDVFLTLTGKPISTNESEGEEKPPPAPTGNLSP
jgi:hypothetical protein